MILGLDISTSITGATILDRHGDVLYCQAWRTDKKDLSFYQKLDIIRDKACFMKIQYPIESIFIEEPLNMFAAGRSSAQVISKIQRFSGACCWITREVFNIEPQYINASTARKLCGITIKRGQKAKEIVLEHVLENEKKFKVQYTKKGNPVKGVYDKADSLVIARAGYYLNNRSHDHETN